MLAFISLFLPPALMVALWNRIKQEKPVLYRDIIQYITSILVINFLSVGVCILFFGNSENLLSKLNTYSDFALKYILLSASLSIGIPTIVHVCKTKVSISVIKPSPKDTSKFWRTSVILYAAVLFVLHIVRIDYNFWGDECYSIALSRMSFAQMIAATANDVHPPLYYLLLQFVGLVTGDNYWGYSLTSLIPYALILYFSLTLIWKRFGGTCSVVLITLASLLNNSIVYNVEVRMYSWGSLFVLLSYCSLLDILSRNSSHHYKSFVFFSLCAAYTHYYALITVAFFYITLLVLSVIDRKKYLKKVLVSCFVTVAAYAPWLIVLIKTLMGVSEGFWIGEYPTIMESLLFVFESNYQELLLVVFIVVMILYFIKELQFFTIRKEKSDSVSVCIKLVDNEITAEAIWVITGILAGIGTAVVGVVVSAVIRPLYLLRYLYPAAIIFWLILGVAISRLWGRRLLSVLLILIILVSGIPAYQEITMEEKAEFEKLKTTLENTVDLISEEDLILTDLVHIAWTIVPYYYPNVPYSLINENLEFPWEKGKVYWLFINGWTPEELVVQYLENQDIIYEEIVSDGALGWNYVAVYKVQAEN